MTILHYLANLVDWAVTSRLLVAALLGGIIGFERERSGKAAGLRTNILVALGAALFTIISLETFSTFPSLGGVMGYDYHMVANIIVGIGFIGAGAILRKEERIEGTTTAASLWVVAAIGIASGFALFKDAITTTVIAYVVLKGLWLVEKFLLTKEPKEPVINNHLHY